MVYSLMPEWMNNYTHYTVWNEITYAIHTSTVQVWEWEYDFIPHFT